jgi:hypothetical protein
MTVSSATPPPNPARLRRLAERLHSLGPRTTFELLKEIANGGDLWRRLERYAELDPEVVHGLGADELPSYAWLVPREVSR